jgi:hypothetical protein
MTRTIEEQNVVCEYGLASPPLLWQLTPTLELPVTDLASRVQRKGELLP